MKKALFAAVFILAMTVSFAQDGGRDYVTMKGDKVYWIRGGQTIKLGISVPLKNGSTVYPNGVIKAKDGSMTRIKKGQRILMDGTVISK